MRLNAESVSYRIDDAHILSDVPVHVSAGELIGLIGPNGAGKSTLLSILAGLTNPTSGVVELDGNSLKNISVTERARTLGWLEQIGQINWPISVRRLISLGRFPHQQAWQETTEEDNAAINHAMLRTDSQHLADRDATTLSGGERARVLLARALAAEPSILLTDEPVSALDLGHQLQTMELLRNFANGEQAAVVVLHDLSLAARYCDRLLLLDQGTLIAEGNAATVLSNDNIRQVYGVEVKAGCDEIPWIVPHIRTN